MKNQNKCVTHSCKGFNDSFLFFDEVENGIHHRLFPKLWAFVLRAAEENNVQVIAATHSWECLCGFAKAAQQSNAVEGRVFRIERKGEETRAVSYSAEGMAIAARSGIEVR